ncbi:MAG: pilus assembly protein [Alphaproteobacteria bacterium]|nr:pilus assembly protein [Alphaproteobacteria bacterium]
MLRFRRLFRIFGREEKGLAAVEFAFVVPVLITMLFGMGELSMAIFARSDITQVASTVADLIAQESTIASTDLSNVYNAANTILYPYYPNFSSSKPTIRVTSVIYDTVSHSTTVGKVAWTCSQSGSGSLSPSSRAVNSTVTFSQPLLSSGSSVLMVEVAYSYASPTTQVISGSYNMTDSFYTKPRRVGQIPAPASCP